MGDNYASSNLTGATSSAYNGCYWQGANICADGPYSGLFWTGDSASISSNSNWDYGFTLNEDAIKEIVEKLTKQKEAAKITPDEGPEIPKWTGFLEI